MGKKLEIGKIKDAFQEKKVTKDLTIKINDEDYDVKIETSFRYSQVREIALWLGENDGFLVLLKDEKVLASLIVLKFLTDIDMGETFIENIEALVFLSEAEVLGEILNAVPTETFAKYTAELEKFSKEVEAGLEQYKEVTNK